MEFNAYKSLSKQIQFLMNNDTSVKKQIQETMKEFNMMNNTNIRAYMKAEVNVMSTQIHKNKGIKLFGKRAILEVIK